MRSILRLINSYYIRGIAGPFFVLVFPILMLFIMSFAMDATARNSGSQILFMRNVIGGITITTLMSNGFIGMPTMVIEFKKSTLIKRIGSANISKRMFFVSILIYQLIWSFISVFWTLVWGGIIVGSRSGYDWTVAFGPNLGITMPFIILAMLVSISIGLIIISLINSQQGVVAVSNLLYMPISFLSGSFIPKQNIDSSPVLSGITYALPTKYAVDPYFAAFARGRAGLDAMGWQAWGFPLIVIAIVFIAIVVSSKRFKWS